MVLAIIVHYDQNTPVLSNIKIDDSYNKKNIVK